MVVVHRESRHRRVLIYPAAHRGGRRRRGMRVLDLPLTGATTGSGLDAPELWLDVGKLRLLLWLWDIDPMVKG